MRSWLKISTISLLFSVLSVFVYAYLSAVPKVAYVNTGKLLVGFSEANKVDREIKTEDEKWQSQLKQLQDSLQAVVNLMSKEYDRAPVVKKKEFQDLLSARNQQVNNFRQANIKKIEELRQKKMQSVFEKVNVYMAEYGKKYKYSLVFGTSVGGNILYADDKKYDITDDLIKGLNERYK